MMLDDICKAYGVRVLSYEVGKDALKTLHLEEAAARTAGLACYVHDTPVIFFDSSRSYMEVLFTVAHELGHIMLGHLSFRQALGLGSPDSSEREADAFAVQLLANELRSHWRATA